MKKVLIVLIAVFMIAGCGKTDDKKTDSAKYYNGLKEKLTEYGKLVYENYQWLNADTKEGKYYMTLGELSERNKYDISMFKGFKTNKECDKVGTKIEFIYKGMDKNNKYIYSFNPILKCD